MWLWTEKNMFLSYLREKLHSLAPDFGVYAKMVMTRASFNKLVLGSSEFGEQYKMILGSNEMKLSTGLVSSSLAAVFTGISLLASGNQGGLRERPDGEECADLRG